MEGASRRCLGEGVMFFYAIFLLNCSVGGQGHHTRVRVDSVKSKEDGSEDKRRKRGGEGGSG